jgi:hypothetical protein
MWRCWRHDRCRFSIACVRVSALPPKPVVTPKERLRPNTKRSFGSLHGLHTIDDATLCEVIVENISAVLDPRLEVVALIEFTENAISFATASASLFLLFET